MVVLERYFYQLNTSSDTTYHLFVYLSIAETQQKTNIIETLQLFGNSTFCRNYETIYKKRTKCPGDRCSLELIGVSSNIFSCFFFAGSHVVFFWGTLPTKSSPMYLFSNAPMASPNNGMRNKQILATYHPRWFLTPFCIPNLSQIIQSRPMGNLWQLDRISAEANDNSPARTRR